MKTRILFTLLILSSFASFSQQYIPYYATVSNQVSSSNVLNYLTEFENLGVKRRGTVALQNTLDWIKNKYISYGYTASQMQEYSFTNGAYTCKNLVLTKIGTVHPNTFVILCGHYDTITGTGTNDNGSGTTILLEVARLLQNIPTEYSIKFINFSGEEDGLIGSQNFVSNVVNSTTPKMDIKLVFNIDEVGGRANMVNNTITCERDTSSPTTNNAASNVITNELITCVGLYSPLNTYLSYAYASDYMPFEDNNEIITGFFEKNETPYRHTANDLLINMDSTYVYNIAKAATGAMMHFAVASTSALATTDYSQQQNIRFFPNPTQDFLQFSIGNLQATKVHFSLIDVNGKTVLEQDFTSPSAIETIAINNVARGMYLAVLETGTTRYTQKVVLR
ncbi:M28 family peptidase [Flavobacterium capsici]|uniref:M28 family peptidase n=1 Tax=Flavobacterium capsici TaxID=3075618 RepID=A0AA96J4R0_9FLAO|nr:MULTISPECIES: M28 family peptidase [unclassified Flavobacterium]WNM18055.1 M28 family peptidase [Flavobacterium sp. PMR2A8]WNM22107.1 M28 family peptidase [Flavobacterium sp. PMTSA4]